MRVVFLEDVQGVALGGDVKEVKNGFARNYLLPKQLAVPASREALLRVERLQQHAEAQRLKSLADMKTLAAELNGTQVQVAMRAGTSGRLYGSVTSAVVAEELSKLTNREIDRRTVIIGEPMRQIGVFEVEVRLHSEVEAKINLIVYAQGTDPMALLATSEAEEGPEGDETSPEETSADAGGRKDEPSNETPETE